MYSVSSLFRREDKMRKNEIFMKAIDENDIEKVKELIEQGANLNIQYEKWYNETPLIRSLKKGHDEIANFLLDNGAMVDVPLIRNYWGDVETGTCALFEAVIRNKYDIVKKMISKGANLNVELGINDTALRIALIKEYTEIAKLLIDNGAEYSNIKIRDNDKDELTLILDYVCERRSDSDILPIFKAIKRREKEKTESMQEIRDTSIRELHNKFNKDGVNRFSNKAIEAYVDMKTKGYISNIQELDNKDIDDLLELYNYKEPVEEKNADNEITQEEIRQLNKSKPIYIRGFRCISTNPEPKHNETAAIAEIRKLLRKKGKPTLTKIKGVKTGRSAQCFSMANYGSIRPFADVGLGAIPTKKKKVRLAASTCMCSAYKKNMDAIAVSEKDDCGSKRDRENMPVYKKIDNMLKNKKWQLRASRYDEVIMDVADEDIKFIYFSDNSNFYKLRAIYLQRKYKELSGRTLPIFKYRVNRKDCFVKKDFTNKEIVAMLKDVLIDDFDRSEWNYDLFVTFNDELNQIPGYRDFVNKFLLREDAFDLYSDLYSRNTFFIKSYGMINKAKYIGLVLGKGKQKEYIKRSFDNIRVPAKLEFMAELKQLEIDEEMKAFLEPKIDSIKNDLIERNKRVESNYKNTYLKYKNVYKEKEEDIYTSLICAIEEKDKRCVLQILGNIQDVNVIDKKTGSLALTEAIRVGDFELIKLLVNEYNADVNKEDGIGYTPISLVGSRKDIKKFLIDQGAECSFYEKGDIYSLNPGEFLGGLLRICWSTACGLRFACSSILMFVNYVCYGIMNRIMQGIGYSIRKFRNYMQILRAPVAYFCTKGLAGEKIVKLLLKVGFSPNKTLYGKRPLMIILDRCAHMKWSAETDAEFKEIQDCLSQNIELLVKYGADVSYRDNSGYSPLEKAIQCGFFATAKFLVQKGADVNGKSNGTSFIMTPRNWPSLLMMASRKRNYDMSIFLIRHGANFEYSYIPNLFRDDRPSALGGVEAGILCAIYNEDKDKLNEMFSYYKDRPAYLEDASSFVGRLEPPTSFMYVLEKYVLPNVQDEQIKDSLKNFMYDKETQISEISRDHGKQRPLLNIPKVEELGKSGPSIA